MKALRRARLDGRPFDVIVLEMQLGATDGISIARMIHADPLIRETPIVLVTAIGRRKSDIDFFKSEDIDTYVMKPVRRAQLTSALMQVVRHIPTESFSISPSEEKQAAQKQILVIEDNIV